MKYGIDILVKRGDDTAASCALASLARMFLGIGEEGICILRLPPAVGGYQRRRIASALCDEFSLDFREQFRELPRKIL